MTAHSRPLAAVLLTASLAAGPNLAKSAAAVMRTCLDRPFKHFMIAGTASLAASPIVPSAYMAPPATSSSLSLVAATRLWMASFGNWPFIRLTV